MPRVSDQICFLTNFLLRPLATGIQQGVVIYAPPYEVSHDEQERFTGFRKRSALDHSSSTSPPIPLSPNRQRYSSA
jgi:hypothetical protein